jgi:uncharacterized protein
VILVDTGPLVALANDKDDAHSACERLLTTIAGPLLVPAPVLTEVCYLLETRRGTGARGRLGQLRPLQEYVTADESTEGARAK